MVTQLRRKSVALIKWMNQYRYQYRFKPWFNFCPDSNTNKLIISFIQIWTVASNTSLSNRANIPDLHFSNLQFLCKYFSRLISFFPLNIGSANPIFHFCITLTFSVLIVPAMESGVNVSNTHRNAHSGNIMKTWIPRHQYFIVPYKSRATTVHPIMTNMPIK